MNLIELILSFFNKGNEQPQNTETKPIVDTNKSIEKPKSIEEETGLTQSEINQAFFGEDETWKPIILQKMKDNYAKGIHEYTICSDKYQYNVHPSKNSQGWDVSKEYGLNVHVNQYHKN